MGENYPLKDLKEDYKKIQKAHSLPSFEELNEDFQIEKIEETDNLEREVRKFMAEKFSNYMRFIEAILQPANAPMFVFAIIKTLHTEDKKRLSDVYEKLAKIEIQVIGLDAEFEKKKEIEFIKENFKLWQVLKKDFIKLVEEIKKNWDNKTEAKGKDYFG